jgi:hypothetical protein
VLQLLNATRQVGNDGVAPLELFLELLLLQEIELGGDRVRVSYCGGLRRWRGLGIRRRRPHRMAQQRQDARDGDDSPP